MVSMLSSLSKVFGIGEMGKNAQMQYAVEFISKL
jgi:hypothetical protein